MGVGKKNRQRDEFWKEAKRLCRLNAHQIAMAKRLGMNPKKLPRLIPSKSQPWKAPVGIFIEELHAKRFGDELPDFEPIERSTVAQAERRVSQVESLVCYFANLTDDLGRALAANHVTPQLFNDLVLALRRLVADLEAGRPVSQVPELYVDDADALDAQYDAETESERIQVESAHDDDEIPF